MELSGYLGHYFTIRALRLSLRKRDMEGPGWAGGSDPREDGRRLRGGGPEGLEIFNGGGCRPGAAGAGRDRELRPPQRSLHRPGKPRGAHVPLVFKVVS